MSEAIRQIDSLSANEFALEVEGERVTGIFRISGLIPFKLDVKPALTKHVREPFKITKMVQRDPDNAFNKWLRETTQSRADIVHPTRTLAIVALDDGEETRRWIVNGAWISEVGYSDFNTSSSELIEQTLIVHYDDIEEQWGEG